MYVCLPYNVDTKEHEQYDVHCRNKSWKKCQLHCYSICKVSDFNHINFLPHHIIQILSHLGEIQPAVATAHRIMHG